jgi:glycerol dehydrogenase-like iron-containing ADH family enzyme
LKNSRYGSGLARQTLEECGSYLIATQPIPWESWSTELNNLPKATVFCTSMEQDDLDKLVEDNQGEYDYIVGLGGGVACDTAKYLAWKMNIPLITIPSIISVDAFLSKEIGIRVDSRVRYVGSAIAEKLIIDYELIRSAPPYLNRAGIGDVLSCTTALGDWKIAQREFGDKFDQNIFLQTKKMIKDMFRNAKKIHDLSDEGLKLLVEYLRTECILSEQWGNARPEEGGEHFLAYALEKMSPRQYLHGALISLNVLVVLKLQGTDAEFTIEEVQNFLEIVGVGYSPQEQRIEREDYQKALEYVQQHVADENLFHGLWSLENLFQTASVDEILDWIYSLK